MVKKATSKRKKSVKKPAKKKTKIVRVKKKPTEVHYHSIKEIKVEKALIENFIGLQKVMVNLSSRFDELSNQISKLLNLFEVSARAMAKKEFSQSQDPNVKKILDRLDNLTQQAGLIGRGLALIHEINEEKHRENTGSAPRATHFEPQPSPSLSPSPIRPPIKTPLAPSGMQPSIMHQSRPAIPTQPKEPLKIPKESKVIEIDEKDV